MVASHSRNILVAAVVAIVIGATAGSDIHAGVHARVMGGLPYTAGGTWSSEQALALPTSGAPALPGQKEAEHSADANSSYPHHMESSQSTRVCWTSFPHFLNNLSPSFLFRPRIAFGNISRSHTTLRTPHRQLR